MKVGEEILLLLAGAFACCASFAREIQMEPGSSPQEAVRRVAELRQSGKVRPKETITVVFPGGDYVLDETILLYAEDGRVTWRAANGATVRFLGGRTLKPSIFRKVKKKDFLSRLPPERTNDVYGASLASLLPDDLPEDEDVFRTPAPPHLYINGKLMPHARWPNEGWTTFQQAIVTGVAPKGSTEIEQRAYDKEPGVFVYNHPRAARWNFKRGALLNGYWTHDWDNESRRAVAWEPYGTGHVIRFAAPGTYGTGNGTHGLKERRFFVFNQLTELDAPGEWYLERKKKWLFLVPPKGCFEDSDVIELARNADLLLDSRASDVRFENIVFAVSAGAGVRVRANDVTFAGCTFEKLGKTALDISGSRNHVLGCTFRELGAGGVLLCGGDRASLARADSSVENCTFHDFGNFERCYAGACVFRGCGLTVAGNTIYNAPHLAILYTANESVIASNEIHHVVMETNDASAIYTGRDWTTAGNVLRDNFIHHLGSPETSGDRSVIAIYFDDCDCGDEVVGNVFWCVPRGILVGGGREHPIRDNLFVECDLGFSIDNRGMTWKNWNLPGTSWHLEGYAEKLRYREDPWRTRYPWLARIMQDDPQEPKNDPVENNVFVNCQQICRLPAEDEKGTKALANLVFRENAIVTTLGKKPAELDKRPSVQAGFRMQNGKPGKAVYRRFSDTARGSLPKKIFN